MPTRYNKKYVLKLFQHLEPNNISVKILEYSLAGKSFMTSEIWEKILKTNQKSVVQKYFHTLLTFKVCVYIYI